MPNKIAIACPTVAATCVARTRGICIARRARKHRPPSIGKAGNILNNTSMTFTIISRAKNGPPRSVTLRVRSNCPAIISKTNSAAAITTLTAGPATAIQSS